MNKINFTIDKYSVYCRDHIREFKDELRNDASLALAGWPGRAAAILLLMSSVITYMHQSEIENSSAVFTLFTYIFPISILVSYPLLTLLSSSLEKHSVATLDILLFSGLLGFLVTLSLMYSNAKLPEDRQLLFLQLSGQINFVVLIGTAFSFHASYIVTFVRNIFLTLTVAFALTLIEPGFLLLNSMQLIQGFLAGSIFSWLFFGNIRTRFYLKSTDADTRQHLYNQLSKLVYPHQLERIKLGDELENTMPLKEGKAIVNVFDVQRSSQIRHERTQDFFLGVFQAFLQICMQDYGHNPLRSRAFRLKETGDGFISAIGYPFLPIDSRSLADSAVSTALTMFAAFNKEVIRFNYSRPIKAAMGLAYNSVQGTFQSGGIRSYDLFGDALIQASKYEELRKHPAVWDVLTAHAKTLGLKNFHILIVQEVVYNSLSPAYRDLFKEIDLSDGRFTSMNFSLMYDSEAHFVYYHLLE